MKLQIVKTDKGYVAISEQIPRQDHNMRTDDEGKWVISLYDSRIGTLSQEYRGLWRIRWKVSDSVGYLLSDPHSPENYRMIVATDTSFKLEGIPQFDLPDVLKGESVNLFLGYDEKSVQALVEKDLIDEREQRIAYHWFWIGLKAAQEKGCYTEEDLRKAINEVFNIVFKNSLLIKEDSERITYDVINSLKQPKKLVAIEVEHEMIGHPHEWIDTPISVKSEQYPDGLLTIKQYFYE